MKKYKFKEKEIVYIDISNLTKYSHCEVDYKVCIIRKRKMIEGLPHYQVSQQESINSSNITYSKEIFDIGCRNIPRMDNWLQEDRIISLNEKKEMAVCSNDKGCELVNEFLEKSFEELIKDQLVEVRKEIDKKEMFLNTLTDIRKDIFVELQVLFHKQNDLLCELNGPGSIFESYKDQETIFTKIEDYSGLKIYRINDKELKLDLLDAII